jgi:hypothetical protein
MHMLAKKKKRTVFGLYKVRFDVSFCRVLKFVFQNFSNFIVNINTVFVKINTRIDLYKKVDVSRLVT